MKKLAKKQTGGSSNTKPWGEMNTKEKTNYLDTKAATRKKSVNVNVSGKMGNLDVDKIRSNQKTTGNNYTFTKVKPGSMSSSDSSYVNRFSKSTPILAKKQNGGPQQPLLNPLHQQN